MLSTRTRNRPLRTSWTGTSSPRPFIWRLMRHLLPAIAIELAKQGISVFLDPLGQMCDKAFDLLPGSFAQRLSSTEISGVRFHQGTVRPLPTIRYARRNAGGEDCSMLVEA